MNYPCILQYYVHVGRIARSGNYPHGAFPARLCAKTLGEVLAGGRSTRSGPLFFDERGKIEESTAVSHVLVCDTL